MKWGQKSVASFPLKSQMFSSAFLAIVIFYGLTFIVYWIENRALLSFIWQSKLNSIVFDFEIMQAVVAPSRHKRRTNKQMSTSVRHPTERFCGEQG